MVDLKYTANYCEENIWQLCQHPELHNHNKQVVFISSFSRNTPLHYQKSAKGELPVWWDYHVILLTSNSSSHLVYDFDSALPFPCPAYDYFIKTFREETAKGTSDCPLFKLIDSEDYVAQFYSDRSHMLDENDNWIFAPPPWPIIKSNGSLSFNSLLDFTGTSTLPIYELKDVLKTVR